MCWKKWKIPQTLFPKPRSVCFSPSQQSETQRDSVYARKRQRGKALTLHLFCQSYFPNVAVTVINGVWWITSQKKALWGLVSYANKWKLMAVWEPGNISKNLKLYSYLSEDRADHFICKSWSIFLHNHTAILPLRLFHLTSITLNS